MTVGATYQIQTPEQLAAYLRALRKSKGLTQSDVGGALGVSAARISEIEQNPATVGFGQIQRLLLLLGARLVLEETKTDSKRSARDSAPRGEW
jgi:transcriptional regulator with XRE-family HTH domain